MSKHTSKKQNPLDDSYWQYFLKLESDFHSATRYIACSKTNDTTCSIEFAQQLVCINTECEAILKKICKIIDPKNPATNMGHFHHIKKTAQLILKTRHPPGGGFFRFMIRMALP